MGGVVGGVVLVGGWGMVGRCGDLGEVAAIDVAERLGWVLLDVVG